MTPVLVATIGTTPQVLTEAFYYHHRHLQITFREVQVLTTLDGAKAMERDLLGASGQFAALCSHLGVPRRSIRLNRKTIHVLRGAGGAPISDVRTTADGDAMAEQMFAILRTLCARPDRSIHATVAGGRKVMGVYLHAMMQLCARPQDRLFHILVHPAIEQAIAHGLHRDFFFPKGPMRLGGRSIAEPDLLSYIEVPILRVAPGAAADRDLSYLEMVRRRQRELDWTLTPRPLVLDTKRRRLQIDDAIVTLTANQFFWYLSLARMAAEGRGRLPVPILMHAIRVDVRGHVTVDTHAGDVRELQAVVDLLSATHRRASPGRDDEFGPILKNACGSDPPGFASIAAKINARLRRVLGRASARYEIQGKKGEGYALLLPPADLVFT